MSKFWNSTVARQKDQKRRWQGMLHEIIFGADTPASKRFDIALIVSILLSVIVVMLDSVRAIREAHGGLLYLAEWFFTILFTAEYLLRLVCVGRPLLYAVSFFGIVDLMAIVPTYLSLLFPGSYHHHLLVIRLLRVLRIFRVLKLVQYLGEANLLIQVLRSSHRKITVFLFTVLTLVVILGLAHVRHRRRTGRVYEHTQKYLLGDRDPHHRRLWRHIAKNKYRSGIGGRGDDPGIQYHRDPDRDCNVGIYPGPHATENNVPGMHRMQHRRPRQERGIL